MPAYELVLSSRSRWYKAYSVPCKLRIMMHCSVERQEFDREVGQDWGQRISSSNWCPHRKKVVCRLVLVHSVVLMVSLFGSVFPLKSLCLRRLLVWTSELWGFDEKWSILDNVERNQSKLVSSRSEVVSSNFDYPDQSGRVFPDLSPRPKARRVFPISIIRFRWLYYFGPWAWSSSVGVTDRFMTLGLFGPWTWSSSVRALIAGLLRKDPIIRWNWRMSHEWESPLAW